jgi:hypothetical protein
MGDVLDPIFIPTRASKIGLDSPLCMIPIVPAPEFEAVSGHLVHVFSKVWPLDEHNLALLDNVRPRSWIDPPGRGVYNLVVIGAGAGGLVTAAGAAGVGAGGALIEAHSLGGDCLNVGCVPAKTLLHAANLTH